MTDDASGVRPLAGLELFGIASAGSSIWNTPSPPLTRESYAAAIAEDERRRNAGEYFDRGLLLVDTRTFREWVALGLCDEEGRLL